MDNSSGQDANPAAQFSHHLSALRDIVDQIERVALAVARRDGLNSGEHSAESAEPVLRRQTTDHELAIRARQTLARRRWRDRCFGAPEMLGEPTWDMLLDLFIKQIEASDVSVSSAAYASYVPLTTALRYIVQLEARGWVVKVECTNDKRRNYLQLTPQGLSLMRTALSDP
jgi:predicted transcriptional regulator